MVADHDPRSGPRSGPAPGFDLAALAEEWQPRPECADGVIDPGRLSVLSEVLGSPAPDLADGSPAPPMWHGVAFDRSWALRGLGADGHPATGPLYPPIPDRRRMFVGGRVRFDAPLRVGLPVTERAEVCRRVVKAGATGEMLFVTVRRTVSHAGAECLVEEQDLMYRSGPAAAPPPSSAPDPAPAAPWTATWTTDPTALFVYSSLTSNAHRIHYDEAYARTEEGFPGLVVHGPLLVLAMLELVRRHEPRSTVVSIDFRLRRPVMCGDRVTALGAPDGDHATLELHTPRHGRVANALVELR